MAGGCWEGRSRRGERSYCTRAQATLVILVPQHTMGQTPDQPPHSRPARMSQFSWTIDGTIVALYLIGTMIAGFSVRKYIGKVEHFLVAGREMNVYLGVASLAATEFGIVTCMYAAELGYKHGFAGASAGITISWRCSWSAAPAFASNRCATPA